MLLTIYKGDTVSVKYYRGRIYRKVEFRDCSMYNSLIFRKNSVSDIISGKKASMKEQVANKICVEDSKFVLLIFNWLAVQSSTLSVQSIIFLIS